MLISSNIKWLDGIAQEMVETKKNGEYPLIYKLVRIFLFLSVKTATVEITFSTTNILKNRLRNRMGDE
ncbi:hypothetical protein ACS0TY_021233 [Phlomoides rotata]